MLLFMLQLLVVSAQDVEIVIEDTYAPRETLQAEIYGNFLEDLELENFEFYRERRIALLYDILELNDKYLLYAILPPTEGNYSIQIKNARYTTETGVSTDTIIKEFEIKSTADAVLTINPGFVVAKDDFYLKLKANQALETEAEFLDEIQTVSLVKNIDKKIYFSISDIKEYTETTVKVGDYEVPVFVFPPKSELACYDSDEGLEFHSRGYVFSSETGFSRWDECLNETNLKEFFCEEDNSTNNQIIFCQQGCEEGRCINDTPISCEDDCVVGEKKCFGNYLQTCGNYDDDYCTEWGSSVYCADGCGDGECRGDEECIIDITETKKLRFSPFVLRATLPEGKKYFFRVFLINLGNTDIKDIEIFSDLDVEIEPETIPRLERGEEELIELTFKSKKDSISGDIIADSKELDTRLKVRIDITEDESEISLDEIPADKTCSELKGEICKQDEVCDGITTFAQQDGVSVLCCQGKCKEEGEKSNWTTGIIIIAIVLLFIILFFVVMRKLQKPKAANILKERQKRFEQRMQPTKGSLSKF